MAPRIKKKPIIEPEEVETLIEKIIRKIKENYRWSICIVALICIVGVVFWGYGKYTQSQNEQAAYAYYLIVKDIPTADKDIENWEKMVSAFLSNYDRHPLSVLVRVDLVRLEIEKNRWDKAAREAEAALQNLLPTHPMRPFFLRYLAIAHMEQGHLDDALKYLDELVKVAPEEWKREIYWKKGLIFEAKGKIDEAKASWQEALKINGLFPPEDLIREHMNGKSVAVSNSPNKS
ncbi:MAG: tetratricopeptide repeat protein [Thermodesulforhabdaceae bacterium]